MCPEEPVQQHCSETNISSAGNYILREFLKKSHDRLKHQIRLVKVSLTLLFSKQIRGLF